MGESRFGVVQEDTGVDIGYSQSAGFLQYRLVGGTLLEPELLDPLLLAQGQQFRGYLRRGEKYRCLDRGQSFNGWIAWPSVYIVGVGIDGIQFIALGKKERVDLTTESLGAA